MLLCLAACGPREPGLRDVCEAVLTCGGQGFPDEDTCVDELLPVGVCADELGYVGCAVACGDQPCDVFPACEAECFRVRCVAPASDEPTDEA
jgi:hypothetical protein